MQDFFTNVFILISALLTVAVGYLFDVPPPILWLAAIGSAGGVAISKPKHPLWGLSLILCGTLVIGQLMPLLSHYYPTFPQKPAAFLAGLLVIGYRQLILMHAPKILVAGFNGIEKAITKLFAKIGGAE